MSKSAHWMVELYAREDGTSPVTEFIEKQSQRDQAKTFAEFDDLAEFGLMPRGRKLAHLEGKLWELRFRGEALALRFIYFAHTGKKIVVLHGSAKKTRKTPRRELEMAKQRLREYLNRSRQ